MTGHEMGDFLLVPKQLQGVTLPQQTTKVDLTICSVEAKQLGNILIMAIARSPTRKAA